MPDLYVYDQNPQNIKKSKNSLSAFCYRPGNARFETQDQKEDVVLLLRRHPITNLGWMSLVIIMSLAPGILFQWFPFYLSLPARFQIASVIFWYLLTLAFAVQGALTWFFNVNIITNQRIVDVDFLTLIYREISDAQISKIQEVTYKVGGFGGTFFNYGNVLIQTAGAIPNFEFENVPKPAKVAEILEDLSSGKESNI